MKRMNHEWTMLAVLLAVSMVSTGLAQNTSDPQLDETVLEWPRMEVREGDAVIQYQPQITSWDDFREITASMAIGVIPDGETEQVYGSMRVKAYTRVNFETREVLFERRRMDLLLFPDVDPDRSDQLKAIVHRTLPFDRAFSTSLDEVLPYLEIEGQAVRSIEVNLEPPPIYYSEIPAVLVMFIGEPVFESVPGTKLLYAVNTNWDILLEMGSSHYFMLHNEGWLTTDDLGAGEWTPAQELPADLLKLPEDENWSEVRQHVPGRPHEKAPRVIISHEPSELIQTEGPPSMNPIPGTKLLHVSNTQSDVFLSIDQGRYYFLTAGRWFRAQQIEGPWSAATTDLPADFLRIPEDHPKAHVRSSVPGTPEAATAVLMASMPHKATVNRNDTKVTVVYDGDPTYVLIDGTSVQYAINSPNDVFLVDGQYYCCHQGVWFVADAATGPWAVATAVPAAIYSIPSTSPKHHVTYVYVYESTPDTVVVGQTSGYNGQYIAFGLLMFGLGYAIGEDDWDDHFHHHHHHYSYHYGSHYYSYGSGARYDYYHGGYYRAGHAYGPYGGAGRGASYNPRTGTYARGAYRYGPSGGVYAREAYNPYTDRYAGRVTAGNRYGSWGRTVVADGDDWARFGHKSNSRGTVAGFETSRGAQGVAARGRNGEGGFVAQNKYGDVYVGKDGKVYKRNDDGQWQRRAGDKWSRLDSEQNRPFSGQADRREREKNIRDTTERLERDSRARSTGKKRTRKARSTSKRGGRSGGRGRGR